jgi:cytosine/adenosine deaminase-related metal-dependent hydrolase
VREALRWVTTEGARMLGREDQIGSLTPGKLADLVIINASDLNLFPVHDPVATVVMQTSLANIEAVMIGGSWKKRNGRLLVDGLDHKKELLAQSGRRLVQDIERQERAA